MATKKKSTPSKTAAKKAVKPAGKPKRKPVAAKATNKKAPATKKMALAAAVDPMGCCTFTNSAGQIMMRNMRQSACSKITGSTFEAGDRKSVAWGQIVDV